MKINKCAVILSDMEKELCEKDQRYKMELKKKIINKFQ